MEQIDKIQFRDELKLRLRLFVLDLLKLCKSIPKSIDSNILMNQVLRSGSSVYANYRAANRARSKSEFFSKISIVVEEADETEMWLDLLIHSNISNNEESIRLNNESLEILKIMATIRKKSNQ
jgi:four helix bundle protein